ncbi:MAG: squalene synthase HpnC [Betaproteobacteria bacterium]|nr:squalene synthase HpnC [Betaproteobacteria bacterium]
MAVGHYENFPVASLFLPPRFRRPVTLIYRFAREADDFADEGDAPDHERLEQLDRFRRELRRIETGAPPEIAWFAALAEVIREHHLPVDDFRDLLSAFSQDVTKKRYADFSEVLDYCRRSANPVGRLLLVLYGNSTRQNRVYSDAICSSLQLINFIQDVASDYGKGRVYLPQDELARFEVSERQIASGNAGGNWRALIAFQVARARELLHSGLPLGRILGGRIGFEMRMIIAGGDRILTRIMDVGGDVFRRRPVLRWFDWPVLLSRALQKP